MSASPSDAVDAGGSARRPLLLALDTSTTIATLALYDGERVLAETTWVAGREHSTQLLLEVDRALARLGLEIGQVTGLVVARGPGSFTGVRVAISVAKGIAAGLGVPVWGVSTLDALARAAGLPDARVWAVIEAGRGRFAVAGYEGGTCVHAPRNAHLDELLSLAHHPAVVIGELDAAAREALAHAGARVVPPAGSLRRAGYLAEIGWLAARSGASGNPAEVDAMYLGRQAT